MREATSDVQFEEFADGNIDLGILIPPVPDKLKAILDYFPVLTEPLVLALPTDSKLATSTGKVSLKRCAGLPFIIFPRRLAPALHDQILGCFRDAGLTPSMEQEAIQMQTIVGLVAAGMGIVLVPQSVSNLKRPGVEYRALKEASPLVEIGLA